MQCLHGMETGEDDMRDLIGRFDKILEGKEG
jgi:hypothetical protein